MANICLDGKTYVNKKMPKIGLGTYEIRTEKEIFDVLNAAFEIGYRLIDTAQVYSKFFTSLFLIQSKKIVSNPDNRNL